MRDHRRGLCAGLSWILPAVLAAAAAQACAPPAPAGDGKAVQAAEGDEGEGEGGAPPDKPVPEGSCDPGPAPECTGVVAGDGTTCLDDAALLAAAQAACDAEGYIAVEIGPAFDCDGAGSTMAKVWCCDEGEPGEVPPQPPASGPSPAGGFGDGVTCTPNGDLHQLAEDACAAMGLALIDFYTTDDCPGGASHYAKYICG